MGMRNAPNGGEDAVEQRVRVGGTAWNIHINREHFVHAAHSGVILAKDAAAASAGACGHDQPRLGHGVVRFLQSQLHVARHRAGN